MMDVLFIFSYNLLVTTGYLVDTTGFLVVGSGYLIAATGLFWLLLVTSRYFLLLLVTCFSNIEARISLLGLTHTASYQRVELNYN